MASPEADRTAEHLWDSLSHSGAVAAAALNQRIKFVLFESHCFFYFLLLFHFIFAFVLVYALRGL